MRGTVDDGDGSLYTDGDGLGFFLWAGVTHVKAYIFLGDDPDNGDITKGRCVASAEPESADLGCTVAGARPHEVHYPAASNQREE